MGILDMPSEVSELALVYSHPKDVAAIAQTCRAFYALVYGAADSHLWRLLWFAQGFEDPRLGDGDAEQADKFDWCKELQRRTRAELVALGDFAGAPVALRVETLRTLVDALHAIPPYPRSTAPPHTHYWVQNLICQAGLRIRPSVYLGDGKVIENDASLYKYTDNLESIEIELRHRLHVYLGLSDYERTPEVTLRNRTEARCFVYDLRNCAADNDYGPLVPGRCEFVNWRYMDHIYDVIARNLDDRASPWPEKIFPPSGLINTRAYSAPGTWRRRQRDWAGVEGKWQRVVCFMDYRDLYEYNQLGGGVNRGDLEKTVFLEGGFEEATRFINLELHVQGYSPTHTNPELPLRSANAKHLNDLGPRPTIHFTGLSKGGTGNEATVVGTVRMTRDNAIRWAIVSIFDGQSQWSSEGVQIGGIASAIGVLGTWTGAQHDTEDPAGPFWLWKTSGTEQCQKCGKRI